MDHIPRDRKHHILRFCCAVILVTLFIGAGSIKAQNAIDFSLKNLAGEQIRLSDYLGKHVILIDFWATWCVPCVKELPHFQKFHDAYEEQGLKIFAITVDGPETVAMVKPFMQRYKYTFPVLLDIESKVIALYNPRVIMPYTVLIDRQGKIRYVHQGYSPGDEKGIEEELVKLLQEEAAGLKKNLSLSVNESFLSRIFSDENYVADYREGRKTQVINRINLNMTIGNFVAGARVDTNLDFTPWKNEFSLAKRFVEYDSKNLSVRAGDFYQSVGRGLIFSLLKTFEKEGLEYIIDTTVDGGKVTFNFKQFNLNVFGGWIKQGVTDLRDQVIGGSLGWNIKNFADLKLNFVGSRIKTYFFNESISKDISTESISLDIPNIADRAKFFGEFSLIQQQQFFSYDNINGHGVYLESGLFFGDLTLLFEFKDYLNLDYEYNRPPMMESELLPVLANQFATYGDDITGISGRVDYYIPGITTLLWSKLTYQADNYHDFPRDIIHIYGGVEKKFKETGWLNLLAGYRQEDADNLGYPDTHGKTVHYQTNLSYPLNPKFSFELDSKGKNFSAPTHAGFEDMSYYEIRNFISLHYSHKWVATFLFDRTSDPRVLRMKDKKNWFGLQLEIKFAQANSVKIFYGSMKGGVKCAGGICKFFPSFEGLRIDGILRF